MSDSLPSSVPMSVIREEIILGGPGISDRGNCGKLSSVCEGEAARAASSAEAILGGKRPFEMWLSID